MVGDLAERVVEVALHEHLVGVHLALGGRAVLLLELVQVVLAHLLLAGNVTCVVLLHGGAGVQRVDRMPSVMVDRVRHRNVLHVVGPMAHSSKLLLVLLHVARNRHLRVLTTSLLLQTHLVLFVDLLPDDGSDSLCLFMDVELLGAW
jgi:hypothetical protein